MGFITAVLDMGAIDQKGGIEPYLKFPFEGEGRVIRVFLKAGDPSAKPLKIEGVEKADLADFINTPEMKLKYLYRDRVGNNVYWGFTPIHKMGKPRASYERNHELFFGKEGNWEKNNECQLHKIKYRVLKDYEDEGFFTPGSVDAIMKELPSRIEGLLDQLDRNISHIVIFGIGSKGEFLYPGDIPAMKEYFEFKLQRSLKGKKGKEKPVKGNCALCSKRSESITTLDKIFKFATYDKVNTLPGLNKKEADNMFPICRECFEKLSAGRERIERTLTNTTLIPGIRMWVIPEGVGTGDSHRFKRLVSKLEGHINDSRVESPGTNYEERYFELLAREGEGLIFHFLFWEPQNAQERVHLMIEDVPPERLAALEERWKEAVKRVLGDVNNRTNLDGAIKSLYRLLFNLAGRSDSDRNVFRDFALKIIGKMLQGERLPAATFKRFVVSRVPRLMYESTRWSDIKESILYAQVWVEFMVLVNGEV